MDSLTPFAPQAEHIHEIMHEIMQPSQSADRHADIPGSPRLTAIGRTGPVYPSVVSRRNGERRRSSDDRDIRLPRFVRAPRRITVRAPASPSTDTTSGASWYRQAVHQATAWIADRGSRPAGRLPAAFEAERESPRGPQTFVCSVHSVPGRSLSHCHPLGSGALCVNPFLRNVIRGRILRTSFSTGQRRSISSRRCSWM